MRLTGLALDHTGSGLPYRWLIIHACINLSKAGLTVCAVTHVFPVPVCVSERRVVQVCSVCVFM